ncbi:MAG TPA: PDZ domain-containing protein [Terriglobales bacterium]|jgi:predicted metalloprotease with PDZ domain|nr:PDZ domain-containing protein [Terriglobales bacterium]
MRLHRCLLILVFLLISAAGFAAPVDYTISLSKPYEHLLHVHMHIPGTTAERDVQLPTWNTLYQIRDFAQNVRVLQATDFQHKALPVRKIDKTTWRISNAKGGIDVDYDIFADLPGPYGAQFNEEHAFLNLAEVLAYPTDAKQAQMTLTFTNASSDWRIATTLPSQKTKSSETREFIADNYDQLVDSPVEIGSFREASFQLGKATYRIVIDADAGDYDMNAIESMDKKIVAAGVDWMNDQPCAEYIFIYHFPHGNTGGGGMEHACSTTIDLSPDNIKIDPLSLPRVSAHEFFHLWNVKRIRPASLEPVDYVHENYTRALWFSEGVTNTVQEILLLRAKILDEKEFLAGLAREVRTLQLRPAHSTQSVEEASLDTWFDKYSQYRAPERSISYYNKGEILGVLLDLAVRRESDGQKSLHEVFEWMNQHYAKQDRFFNDSEGVRTAVEAVTGKDFGWFFRAYVSGVEELPYDDLLATVGLKLVQRNIEVPTAGLGTVRNGKRQTVVVAVDSRSNAGRAGVAPGDLILQFNGKDLASDLESLIATMHAGDTVKLKVAGSKGTREIKIKLESGEDEDVSIVNTDHVTPQQRARRAAWLAGEAEQPHP